MRSRGEGLEPGADLVRRARVLGRGGLEPELVAGGATAEERGNPEGVAIVFAGPRLVDRVPGRPEQQLQLTHPPRLPKRAPMPRAHRRHRISNPQTPPWVGLWPTLAPAANVPRGDTRVWHPTRSKR